jgi:hypothetical protein
MEKTQQDVLREASKTLGLTQKAFAKRMGASWATFENWLSPDGSSDARKMPPIAWQLVQEILAHEELKKSLKK